MLACYTITPDRGQWYRINTNEITDSHNVAICNDASVNMVELSPAEPYEANIIETLARLSPQTDIDHITNRQFIANNHNTNKNHASSNSIIPPDNQSTLILQQSSIMTEESNDNFTKQVSSDITKMTKAHNTAQEHTGKLIVYTRFISDLYSNSYKNYTRLYKTQLYSLYKFTSF